MSSSRTLTFEPAIERIPIRRTSPRPRPTSGVTDALLALVITGAIIIPAIGIVLNLIAQLVSQHWLELAIIGAIAVVAVRRLR